MIGTRHDRPRVEVAPRPSEAPDVLQVVPAVSLAAAAAIVTFLGAVLVWRPPPVPTAALTLAGSVNVQPEHDVGLYLGFGAAFLALAAVLGLVGGRRRRRQAAPGAALARSGLAVVVAGAATFVAVVCFVHARNRLPSGPRILPSELVLFCVMAAVMVLGAWKLAPVRPPVAPAPAPVPVPAPEASTPLARFPWRAADLIVPLVIVAVVYMPGWRRLAGNAFSGEEFLHIDYFAMGPAVAFRKGLALGSGVHVYYGMGWALALTKLPLVRTLSYGHFIRLEVMYGCIYFVAVYGFLRIFTRSWQWAVAGTALAFLFQLFGSYSAAFTMWRFPSATVLRWMFDIWFFLACLLHLRTRKDGWLVAGGLLIGLALLFQTDTGMYLGLSAAFFGLCLWRLHPGSGRRLLRTGAIAGAGGATILIAGLGVASRWTLLDRAFWDGWLENLRLTRAGGTLLPLLGISGKRVLVFFTLMMATYLAVAGYVVVRFVHRRLTEDAVLLGTIAVYGFLTLLYYVGRSNPHNLFRPAVPFAILLAAAPTLFRTTGRGIVPLAGAVGQVRQAATTALPWVAMTLAVGMLLAHPGFEAYPSLLKTALLGSKTDRRCALPQADVCDVDPDLVGYAGELEALAGRLEVLGGTNRQVAIVDSMGPLVYSLADVKPWGRYLPMFPGLFLRSMVRDVVEDLQTSPPDIVVMRSRELRQPFYDDMWQAMRPTVEQGYTLDSRFGPLEVWQRRVAGVAGGGGGTKR